MCIVLSQSEVRRSKMPLTLQGYSGEDGLPGVPGKPGKQVSDILVTNYFYKETDRPFFCFVIVCSDRCVRCLIRNTRMS